ncbi:MAG: hypothetical protein KJ674_02790 [Nanoarchaeota archaeon]|nr:hypothetical protein [Nanoarchaeota archaeon]
MNCIQCKGKHLCSRNFCPFQVNYKTIQTEHFQGNSPPQVFIGSKLYPRANVGILSPPEQTEDSWVYNNPNYWTRNKYQISEIVNLRKNLINSRFETSIKQSSKFLDISKEIAMSYKPVDVEIELMKKPHINQKFDTINMPLNIPSPLKKINITSNPKIHQKVDKVVNDIDLKANDAVLYLKDHFDEHFLTQLISIGVLGLKHNRKLVPTRWSITAIDDILGKNLTKKIKNYPKINEYRLYQGDYFGNYYFIMLFPEIFSYELFENYFPGAIWNFSGKIETATDYEDYYGRKTYASKTAGGYYAARYPILNYLNKIKKQASILTIRFETPEYTTSLGVWVCRNAGKITMSNKYYTFETKEEMLNHVRFNILRKFKHDIQNIYKKSILLNKLKTQSKLKEFF